VKYISVKEASEKLEDEVDAVEIVRCHDCKHYMTADCPSTIRDWQGIYRPQISASGFCSCGDSK
jgi:hypothetical protein